MSHLLQMRGLKREARLNRNQQKKVASFTDAWIETKKEGEVASLNMSHLLQMRGLKPCFSLRKINFRSHLLQMRGLKLLLWLV